MAYRNIEDQRAASKKHYYQNKERYLERNRRKRAAITAIIRQRKDRPCMDCGKRYPHYVMDFDHLGDKLRSVACMLNTSLRLVENEIAKCEVVCSNCHRVRTYARIAQRN